MITIYGSDGTAKTQVACDDNSTQAKELQGDNVLTLSFTLYEHVALEVNDYAEFMGERYWLMERYKPEQVSTVEWKYDVKLYGIESLLKRFLVLNDTDGADEPVFTLTAPPREHVALIVKSINNGMDDTTDWKVGTVEGTENIVIDYEGKYCDEALKEVAEKVGNRAEWWCEGQTVNVCRCEQGEEVALGYGKGLTGLGCDMADNAKFYTRLYPIGSSKNIDPERYGHSRLQLPGGVKHVDVNVEKYGVWHHYEADAFSDIYPKRTGTVSSVRSEDVTDEDGTPFKIFHFKDNSLVFDPNSYEIGGKVKRVSFQEGSELAGLGDEEDGTYYFEVNYNSDTHEFELITTWPYDDDTQLPNDTLCPKPGDKYILWNIRMPDEYYPLAEQEFREAVDKYNEEHAIDVSRYKAPTDHVYIEENGIDLYVGRRVRLESEKYFPETGFRRSRITKVTRKVNQPSHMDVDICDATSAGAMETINDSITDAKSYVKTATSGSFPDLIRSWDKTYPTDNNVFSARRTLKEGLSRLRDDTAAGVITFLKGLLIGEGTPWEIDGTGNAALRAIVAHILTVSGLTANAATVETLTAGVADIASAAIKRMTSEVAFERLATFARGVVAELARSGDFETGLQGFGIYKTSNGRYRLEIDELLVRVKAIFNELEIRKLSYAGGNIELSGAGSTIYRVRPIYATAGGNLISRPDFPAIDPAVMRGADSLARSAMSLRPMFDAGGAAYNELHVEAYGRGALLYYGLYYDLGVEPGGRYTFSFYYRTPDIGDGCALEMSATLEPGGDDYYVFPIGGAGKLELEEALADRRVELTVDVPQTCHGLRIKLWQRKNGQTAFSRPRLEKGGKATAWGAVSRWRCWLAKDDGTTRTRNWWRVGDMAKCQTFNIESAAAAQAHLFKLGGKGMRMGGRAVGHNGSRSVGGNRYYWRLVTATGTDTLEDGREYDWIELTDEDTVQLVNSGGETVTCTGKDDVFGDEDPDLSKWHAALNDAPQAGDEIVQEGSQTDTERQHVIRLTVVGENAPSIEEYVGVGSTTEDAGPYNLAARRKTAIAPRTGNVFVAKRFEMETDDGRLVRVPMDRGEWRQGTTYGYYDRVTHGGSLWLCVTKNGTTTEPKEGSPSWQLQVASGHDGADGADGVSLMVTPSTLVLEQSADTGQIDLTNAKFTLRVLRGAEDITDQCTIMLAASGCEVSGSGGTATLTGLIDSPREGYVEFTVGVLEGGSTKIVRARGTFYVNYLGTFRETIENDVKEQIASKEFTYTDADGTPHTVQGLSQIVQSAEGISSEVLRIQPAGNVIADGKFADGLAKWGVSGDTALTTLDDGWPCVGIGKDGVLEQTSNNMLCDWAQLVAAYGEIYVTVRAKVRSDEDTSINFSMENSVHGGWLEVPGGEGWTDAYTQGYISGDPGYLRFQNNSGAQVWVRDIQLIPDIDAALSSKIEQTAEGITQTVTGLGGRVSTLEQTAEGFEFAVQATGNVIANGNFAEGSDKWQVTGGGVAAGAPDVVEKDGVRCVQLPTDFGSLEQGSEDMGVDWAEVLGEKEDSVGGTESTLEATVGFRYYANSATNIFIGLTRGGSYVAGSAQLQVTSDNVGAWHTAKVALPVKSYIPDTFSIIIPVGSADVWVTDIWLTGDFDTLLGSRIRQASDSISLKVRTELADTGIDIAEREIRATSDNFVIQNNSGEETMRVDKDGQLNITKLSASSDGARVTLGYETAADGTVSPVLRGIDSKGRLIWTFDGESHMNTSDDVDMTILSTSSARLSVLVFSSYRKYDMELTVRMRVTNRSNAAITYDNTQLICQAQRWTHNDGNNTIQATMDSPVEIASGETRELVFRASYSKNISTSGGEAIDPTPVSVGDVLLVEAYYGEATASGLRDSTYLTVLGLAQ